MSTNIYGQGPLGTGYVSRAGDTMSGPLNLSTVTVAGAPVDPTGLSMPTARMPMFTAPATTVTEFQSGHGWTYSAGGADDTTNFVRGSRSASMPTAGAGATYKIEKTGLSLDTTGKQIRLRMKLSNIAHVFDLSFFAGNDSGYANSYKWTLLQTPTIGQDFFTSGDWLTITLSFTNAVTTGSPTRSGITALKATIRDDNTGQAVPFNLQSVDLINEPAVEFPNGLVSITFDDNFDTQWQYGKAYMDSKGLRGSLYVIQDLIGQTGRLSASQLLTMQDQGWEVGAHTNTNANHTSTYLNMTQAQIDVDARSQIQALRSIGCSSVGMAYPQGYFGPTSDALSSLPVSRRYAAYGRTVSRRTTETWPPADLYRLRATSGVSTFSGGYAPTSIYNAGGDLDKAKTNHGWLILVFHKIVTGVPATTTEIAQSDFNAIIDKIVANGMDCLPIGDALRYFG